MHRADYNLTEFEQDEILNISEEVLATMVDITKELTTIHGFLATDTSLVRETINKLFYD